MFAQTLQTGLQEPGISLHIHYISMWTPLQISEFELHEMGVHGKAAAHKPKITMRSAKRRLEWCKARRH